MKRLLSLIIIVLTSVLMAFGDTFSKDGITYNTTSANTVEVSYANQYLENIEIPSSVVHNEQTYSVTSIKKKAFYKETNLKSIIIPNSVTSIGSAAFYFCTNLASVTIPNSVTSIGSNTFDGTIFYYNLDDGLIYLGKVAYHFKGTMPDNTSIVIKEGTISISSGAFGGCSGLTSITIPNSVTSIGDYAFRLCI